MYNFIDLFAGCGGLSEGFLSTGLYNGIAHVEWELPMVQTLRNRLITKWGEAVQSACRRVIHFDIQRAKELLYGNWSDDTKLKFAKTNQPITQEGLVKLIDNQPIDLIIGGPPCQAYSIHGRAKDPNSMQDDYRNFLFENFVEIVDSIKPKAFIFENVVGMLSAKPGGKPVIERIHDAFLQIGYDILPTSEFKNAVFNAYDYQVAQNRNRVILFGVNKQTTLRITDFYLALREEADTAPHLTVKDAIGDLPAILPLETIQKIGSKNHSHYSTDNRDRFHAPRHCSQRDLQTIKTWIANDMNKCSQSEAIDFYKKVTGKDTLYLKYRNLEWDKPSPTVVAHLQKDGFMFIHPDINQARFITVREAACLMSFPRDFVFSNNRAYNYRMIGNAVPVNFAKAIAYAAAKTLSHNG